MSATAAIQQLRAMGLTPVIGDGACHLEVDGERLPLGADPHWPDAVDEARDWLESLSERAGRQAERLRARRVAAGFETLAAFSRFSALDEAMLYEAEAGLRSPSPVHLRILEWLESGALTR